MRVMLTSVRATALPAVLALLAACSPDQMLGSKTLPPDVPDPEQVKSPEGAVATYRAAVAQFKSAFGGVGKGSGAAVIFTTALLTDELESSELGLVGVTTTRMQADSRVLPEYSSPAAENGEDYVETYSGLQRARGQIQEARGALAAYAPDAPMALRGRLDVFDGYIHIFLADLFCSGIPLSTLEFEGDYTYQPGSSTTEVYGRALALFERAITLAADSAGIIDLARVGTGRALLALGRYAEAAQAVAAVPDGFRYEIPYSATQSPAIGLFNQNFMITLAPPAAGSIVATMTDGEGGNGLPYLSSNDPRTPFVFQGNNQFGRPQYLTTKYAVEADDPIVLADWVEARLIEAEAALQAGDTLTWLGELNHLRQTAISPALPDTTDPGTDAARVDLLFRERGFWLFLTGHRQGDLRRLIRQYGRNPEAVYPTGDYPGASGRYGTDVNAPMPATERAYNPKFAGCLSRGA